MEQQTGSQPSQESPAGAQEAQGRELVVAKESLIDWSVRDGIKVVAWIGREDLGYRVRFVEFGEDHPGYWFRYFRDAKKAAMA